MNKTYSIIYIGLIIASIISLLIGIFSNGKTSMGAYIAGYAALILGLMLILIFLFNNLLSNPINSQGPALHIIKTLVSSTGPFLLMLCVIGFNLYLLITYKDSIIEGRVSKGYTTFSGVNILLLFSELYLVFKYISTPNFETTGKISKFQSSILYLLTLLLIMSSIITFVILKYFKTDGFTSI